jgi:hypothetical protein
MDATRARVWQERGQFTFDHHVPELLAFFRSVIRNAGSAGARPLHH